MTSHYETDNRSLIEQSAPRCEEEIIVGVIIGDKPDGTVESAIVLYSCLSEKDIEGCPPSLEAAHKVYTLDLNLSDQPVQTQITELNSIVSEANTRLSQYPNTGQRWRTASDPATKWKLAAFKKLNIDHFETGQ